jgi:hypothetical protein
MATGEALARRARKRGRRKLLLEAVAVFGLTALAAVIIYFVYRHPIGSPWKVAGTSVQDISNEPGLQTEVSVAVDPSNAKVLFAASNETLEPEIRVYSSTNGGHNWTTAPGPVHDPNTCSWGDPAVAVGRDGRQYVAFTEKSICAPGPDLSPYLVVGSRKHARAPWTVRRVTRPAVKFGFDDKPAIAVGHDGRAYVAWSRLLGKAYQTTVVSSTSDGGRTWSEPLVVSRKLRQPQLVAAAAGEAGSVYLAGVDEKGIWVARSTNGGRSFTIRTAVAQLPGNQAATCLVFGKFVLPQQAVRCLGPNPDISLAGDRLYVTYGVNGADQTFDVAIVVLDRSLRTLSQGAIATAKKKSDQFWPTSTVDAKTGKLWACYYDTSGDSERRHAWFSCTSSSDGRRWTEPVRATPDSQNSIVLWEDARISGYGDSGGWGGYVGVAAANGAVMPLWINTHDVGGNQEEVFASVVG